MEQLPADGTVTTKKLAPSAITNEKIANGAVTTEKLANSAIDDKPTVGSDNLVKSGGVFSSIENIIANMQFSSSHIATSNENAVFQNNHIKDVVMSFKEDYINAGYTFRIYQLGYSKQFGGFFFDGALYANNAYIKVKSNYVVHMDAIPSNDKNYYFDILYYDDSLSRSTYKIGEISFTYLWSKITKDPSPYLLNATTDERDAMHIEVSNFKILKVDDSLNLTTTNSLSGIALNELPSNNKYFEYIFTSSANGSVVTNKGMYNSRMIVTSTSDSRLGVKVIDGSIQKIKKINIKFRVRNVATTTYPGTIYYKKDGHFIPLNAVELFPTILVKNDAYTTIYFEDEEGVDSIFYLCNNPIDIEIVSLFIEFTQPIETFFISENNEIKNQLGEIKSKLGEDAVVFGQNNIFESNNQITVPSEYDAVNTPALFNGYLQYIKGRWGGTGSVCKFYIGFIDQNGYLIIKSDFDIEVPTKEEIITVDCSNLGIVIEKGDLLWVRYNAENSPVTPHYAQGEGTKSLMCDASTMKVKERDDNVCLMYSYGIRTVSLEELKDKVIENSDNINTLDKEIEALKSIRPVFLKDRATKKIYELIVTNGQLGITTTTYSNAVVLGNSITNHPIRQNLWWGVWGMAATKRENDFVHVLKATLQTRVPDAECIGVNIANWELDFTVDKATLLNGVITSDTDLVVIRIGENVSYEHTATFESALRDLIAYIYTITPTTKIVITGQFWTNEDKETACINAAKYYNLTFVKINQYDTPVYKESVGNYVYGDDGQQHEITHAGVANHPSDIGMKAIANAISAALGY